MDAGRSSENGEVACQAGDVVAEGARKMSPRRYRIDPPPSANAIWRNVKGRTLKSRVYRQWLEKVKWDIHCQHATQHAGPPLEGPASVTISLRRPRANADIDNRIKPVLDALEAGGAIVDDKNVTSVCAAWADHEGCQITVSADVGAAG